MTSNPYIPDEVELRDCYAASLHEHAGEDYVTAKADAERGIAKIKADALRKASRGGEVDTATYLWLHDRADRIEEEA